MRFPIMEISLNNLEIFCQQAMNTERRVEHQVQNTGSSVATTILNANSMKKTSSLRVVKRSLTIIIHLMCFLIYGSSWMRMNTAQKIMQDTGMEAQCSKA